MEQFSKFDQHNKSSVSTMIFESIYTVIESPVKSLVATTTGFVTSFIPAMVTIHETNLEVFLQLGVLLVTFLLGLTSIITWCQKQLDRRKKLKENKDDK